MGETTIEWADFSFNPWSGCTKVSEACRNCYAEALANRFPHLGGWGPGAKRVRTSETNWRKPLAWNRKAERARVMWAKRGAVGSPPPRPRVFCASLADWLDPEVPIEWLRDLLGVISATPGLDWLLLTKRPQLWRERMEAVARLKCDHQGDHGEGCGILFARLWLLSGRGECKPRHGVWVGATAEDEANAGARLPHLRAIPASTRFVSYEPALGPVDWKRWLRGIDWVICGGESGPGARPMHPEWARQARDRCVANGVAFHFKQWGAWAPIGPVYADDPDDDHTFTISQRSDYLDGVEEVAICPKGYQAQGWDRRTNTGWCHHQPDSGSWWLSRVGKREAGRELDGRTWDEVPS